MSNRRTREQQRKKFQELITGNTGNETWYKRLRTNDNSTIVSSGSGSNDNNVEVIRQTLEVSNNNLGIINSGSRDNNDNPIIIGREKVRGRGRDANDDDDSSIISSRGRGRGKVLSNNNFGNHFEGIRKYIEVIIFRFIIKNFLFITVY